jgi:hypothetical protein
MAGSMIISLHLTTQTHEGVYVLRSEDQNRVKVLGNTIKKDLRLSEIE